MPACSNLKITHDPDGVPTVLLNYGDKVTDLASLDGGQLVEEIQGLRVAGINTVSRGNERHTLSIGKMTAITGAKEGALTLLRHAEAVPKTSADIKIEIEGHATSHFILSNAIVEKYPASTGPHYITTRLDFIGGQLTEVTP